MNGMTWNEIPGDIIVATTDRTILAPKYNYRRAATQIARFSKYNLPKNELKDKINESITEAIKELKYTADVVIHRQNAVYIAEVMEELNNLYNFKSHIEHTDTETIIHLDWYDDICTDKRKKRNRR